MYAFMLRVHGERQKQAQLCTTRQIQSCDVSQILDDTRVFALCFLATR